MYCVYEIGCEENDKLELMTIGTEVGRGTAASVPEKSGSVRGSVAATSRH